MATSGKRAGARTKPPQTGPKPTKSRKKDELDLEQNQGMQDLAAEAQAKNGDKKEDAQVEGEVLDLKTEAGRAAWFINYRAWQAKKKLVDDAGNLQRAERKKLTKFEKTLIAELGVDAVRLMQRTHLSTQTGGKERMKKEVEQDTLVLANTTNMYVVPEVFPEFDPRPLEQKAYDEGLSHGLQTIPFQPIYGQGTVAADRYREGHIEGTKLSTTEGARAAYAQQQGPTHVGPPSKDGQTTFLN